jgi:polar amino acid transport system substrate-binding protein
MMSRPVAAVRGISALLLLLAAAPLATAQTGPDTANPAVPSGGAPLVVYTKPIEPFAFERNGKATGFSLDLWDRLAKDLGLTYELRWGKSVKDVIDVVAARQADVGVAAISITSEREKIIDFSQPFYEAGLSILVNAQPGSATSAIFETLASVETLKLLGILALFLLVTGHLVWLFERKINPEQFPEPYGKGVWESSWWAISTILSGGCDAKGPVALGGRIVGAMWMLICIVVITYFTAVITTIMTVNQLTSDINGPSDLPGKKVATVKGTTAEAYLLERGAKVSAFDTIDQAYAALANNDVKAVVYDEPILRYHVSTTGGSEERVVGPLFQRQNYGIAVQQDSPYRKRINEALLRLREEGVLDEFQKKWFGDAE